MSNYIVNVNVSQIVAAAPSNLQQTGAFVSQGGTTTAANTVTLITQLSDLVTILSDSTTIVSATWAAGVVTVVTTDPHGIAAASTQSGVITGCVPTAYNGTYPCTYVDSTTFTYPLTNDPGVISTLGSFELASTADLLAMGTTFFAQGSSLAVYVLELGSGSTADGVTALEAYIADPTTSMYAYLLPKSWDTEGTAYTMAANYESLTAKTYFYVTTTLDTYTDWEGIKSVLATVPSPSAPSTEFTAASIFWTTLSYALSATQLMSPLSFTFVVGVTPYVLTQSQQTTLKAAGVNWIGTGAEGGISNKIIFWGTMMDVNPFTYWYAIDWLNINVHLALANAIINGSNTPSNPLQYNQPGVNTLQKVAQATVNNGIAFGVILSPASVTAIPFTTYVAQNPSDYASGTYNGLACTFVPARGFTSITIYLTASQIPV